MLISFVSIIAVGVASFYFTDLGADAALYSTILPIVDFCSLVAIALWFVMFFHSRGIKQATDPGGSGGDSGSAFDGGDGSGGD